jgi:uncharacterized protein DUF6152
MKTRAFCLLVAVIVLTAPTSALLAHHSISAEFDGNRRVMLTGTVTKVEWANPHTFFYIDVKDSRTGDIVNWACELGSPNMLLALGWRQTTLKVGMTVSLTGTLARDGSRKVNARDIVADGNRLTSWPSERGTP